MDSALHLLGIARKAGRLEVGEEPVGAAARARRAKLILIAADAAENSARRAAHFAQGGKTPWMRVPYDKGELGAAVGRSSCAMLALTDAGFSAAVTEKLAARDPDKYGPAAGLLREKADRALQRQKEQRQHEKNLRRGKQKPWAPPPPPREEASPPARRSKRPASGPGGRRLTGKFRKP